MLAILTILFLCWAVAAAAMFFFVPCLHHNPKTSWESWQVCRIRRLGAIFATMIAGCIILPSLESQLFLLLGLTIIYSLSTTLFVVK